jgi:hypothetical protein
MLGLLTGEVVGLDDPGAALLLFFIVVICWCYFEVDGLTTVGLVVDDDTAKVDGIADSVGGFTVFAPHMRDSVVLTTLRSGLLGSHIFALSSAEIDVTLGELLLSAGDDAANCCAYVCVLLQIAKISTLNRTDNAIKIVEFKTVGYYIVM